MAHQIQDDGFHEIQLNGKQLVFLFMAATVVSVVIFLCGVLVGRGVRAERAASDTAAAVPAEPSLTAQQAPVPTTRVDDPTSAAPPAADTEDDVTYPKRLGAQNPAPEHLKPTTPEHKAPATTPQPTVGVKPVVDKHADRALRADKTAKAAKPAETAKAADTTKPADSTKETALQTAVPREAKIAEKTAASQDDRAPAAAGAPSGDGFAVQIAAFNVRTEADAIAKRLSSKGYSAYVLSPANGTPSVYRVRVGKFPTRREAESVAARLQKEEQFKPWVTR